MISFLSSLFLSLFSFFVVVREYLKRRSECGVNLRNEKVGRKKCILNIFQISKLLVQSHDLIMIWLKISKCSCLAMLDSIDNILKFIAEFPSIWGDGTSSNI